MALGISEAVYENAICISPLKGNTGAEIVREVQKQMTGFQTTGDCSVDLGKTSQRIKMTRKGYQVQVERRKKADQLAKEKISAQIKSIRREIRDTEDQKNQLGEQEDALRMNEESNGYHLLDERIGALENKKSGTESREVWCGLHFWRWQGRCFWRWRQEVRFWRYW